MWAVSFLLLTAVPLVSASGGCKLPTFSDGECHCGGPQQNNLTCSGTVPVSMLQNLPRLVKSVAINYQQYKHLGDPVRSQTGKKHQYLTHLDLSHNNIHTIDDHVFSELPHLTDLILVNNSFKMSHSSVYRLFSSPAALLSLDLSLNPQTPKNLQLLANLIDRQKLTSLRTLSLRSVGLNKMADVLPVMCSARNLKRLDISYNNISQLTIDPKCSFNMIHLQMNNNAISSVDPLFLESLDEIQKNKIGANHNEIQKTDSSQLWLNILNNPITCDCAALDLLLWIQSTSVKIASRSELECGSEHLHYRKLADLTGRELCDREIVTHKTSPGMAALYAILALTLVTAAVLLFVYRHQVVSCYRRSGSPLGGSAYHYSSVQNENVQPQAV